MRTDACNRKRHMGVDFAIWGSEGVWFWFLISANGEGGMIGASNNEAEALGEACLSIEEKISDLLVGNPATKTLNPLEATVGLAHAIR
jgi:hypothetical protein